MVLGNMTSSICIVESLSPKCNLIMFMSQVHKTYIDLFLMNQNVAEIRMHSLEISACLVRKHLFNYTL